MQIGGNAMTEKKMERLKEILQDSSYTVAICGSGMMEEGGYILSLIHI